MGKKVWACPDRHMQVGAGRVWMHGWMYAGYNCEHKQKEKKETLTYWHRQAGRHRQEWVQGEKAWACPDRCMQVGAGRGVKAWVSACRLQS